MLVTLAIVAMCGCQMLATRPVEVMVIDAETGQPIEGARIDVEVAPLSPLKLSRRKLRSGRYTDKQGRTEVLGPLLMGFVPSADGYLDQTTFWPMLPTNGQIRDGMATIRLYAEPRPKVTIVVEDGYRGPILIERFPNSDWVQGEVGQRDFVFRANKNGYIRIDATPLLMGYWETSGLTARYANGKEIPEWDGNLEDNDVGLRWGTSNAMKQVVVVGTKDDHDRIVRMFHKSISPHSINSDDRAFEQIFANAAQ